MHTITVLAAKIDVPNPTFLLNVRHCLQVIQPVRSSVHDNVSGTIASGLDMWHDAHGSSNASRFASHSAWDIQHDEQILQDAAK